jgi:hypothetical protein
VMTFAVPVAVGPLGLIFAMGATIAKARLRRESDNFSGFWRFPFASLSRANSLKHESEGIPKFSEV